MSSKLIQSINIILGVLQKHQAVVFYFFWERDQFKFKPDRLIEQHSIALITDILKS